MEIRVQVGGLNGIKMLVSREHVTVDSIHDLIEQAEAAFGGLEHLPYDRILPSVSRYQGRKSRKRNRGIST